MNMAQIESPTELKEYLDSLAPEYEQGTFWKRYVAECGRFISPKVAGKHVLEMGCSTLVVSEMLAAVADKFEIVEGAESFARNAERHFGPSVTVHHALFEEFTPESQFEAIVFTNTLHHVFRPAEVLTRVRGWLAPGGVLYITVPNMRSLHRQIGVKMRVLADVFAATARNETFGQPGRYTKESLVELCTSCGFKVNECFTIFLKPFSDEQMESLDPSDELVNALFEMGRELDDLGCLIYTELTP